MQLWAQVRRVLIFTAIGFGPIVIIGGVLLVGILLNLAIMTLDSSTVERADLLLFLSLAVLIPALLVIVPSLTLFLFNKVKNWLLGSITLYGAWLFLITVFGYLMWGAVAGTSMAVVDGAANAATTRSATVAQTLSFVLYCHVAIVPWVLVASWTLGRNALARFIRTS